MQNIAHTEFLELIIKGYLNYYVKFVFFHIFLLGAGSDQQPGASSSNHLIDVRHWMAGL